jgi:hypothetical protein
MFNLEVVKEDKRLSDSELERKFAEAAPKIFGALLDGLVAGLENLTDIPRQVGIGGRGGA